MNPRRDSQSTSLVVLGDCLLTFAVVIIAASMAACGGDAQPLPEGQGPMSFFIVSRNLGGGDLGGLAGADAHCQALAQAAGSQLPEWRAYLSASSDAGAVHAKDRIGPGPWFNMKGVQVAATVADLHSDNNRLGAATSLTEKGDSLGRPHDILTGSNADGTLAVDATCANWTSRLTNDRAMLGHYDKRGGGERPRSWNSAHISQGCSLPSLEATAGDARFYCFAITTTPRDARLDLVIRER